MLNLKKTAIAVAALAACGAAQAGGYTPPACTGVNVTVPCEETAWDVGIQALYFQPVSETNQYWGFSNDNNGNVVYHDIDPDWDWGFRLEGSYHFGTGNDINVNWTHFSNSTNRGFHGTNFTIVQPGFPVVQPVGTDRFYAYNDIDFDAVNVEFGQHVDFGENKNIRFHGGVQYARIDFKNTYKFWNSNVLPTQYVGFYDDSKFNGFGPRAGLDMSYDFGNGFSILSSAAGSILVGTIDSRVDFHIQNVPAASTYAKFSKTAIVPAVEAKLGAKYTHAMAQGDLSIEGGWSFANYWQAVQSNVIAPHNNNFGYQGPYIGLKWVGNA